MNPERPLYFLVTCQKIAFIKNSVTIPASNLCQYGKKKYEGLNDIAEYNSFEITLNNLKGYYSHRDVSDLLVPDPSKTCYVVLKDMTLGLQIMMLANKKEFKNKNLIPPMRIINVGIRDLQVNLSRLVLG